MRIKFNSLLPLTCLLSLLGGVTLAFAGPLEDGHDAFDNKDYKKAFEIWEPLAVEGDGDAQYNLALLYLKGNGVKKNERVALTWFTHAGNQDITDAQYNAGVMFYLGQGVYPDYKSAIQWWELAAETGHANAQNNLAIMHAYASGTRKDTDKALALWTKAAEQGHPDARHSLISAYTGAIVGFPEDLEKANYWTRRK